MHRCRYQDIAVRVIDPDRLGERDLHHQFFQLVVEACFIVANVRGGHPGDEFAPLVKRVVYKQKGCPGFLLLDVDRTGKALARQFLKMIVVDP